MPDFVGLQVDQWMQELNDKRAGGDSKSESNVVVVDVGGDDIDAKVEEKTE